MEKVQACTICQSCKARLNITGIESLQRDASSRHSIMAGSVFGGGKIDESFIVLDPGKQSKGMNQGAFSQTHRRLAQSTQREVLSVLGNK